MVVNVFPPAFTPEDCAISGPNDLVTGFGGSAPGDSGDQVDLVAIVEGVVRTDRPAVDHHEDGFSIRWNRQMPEQIAERAGRR